MPHRLTGPEAELVVDPADGGRWVSLRVADLELLGGMRVPGAWPAILSGCFVMAPYAGRVGQARLVVDGVTHPLPRTAPPHAIHGTVLDRSWSVTEQAPDRLVLGTDLGPDWPYAGRVAQTLALTRGGLTATVRLTADEAMPATLGLHPWFRRRLDRGDPVVVRRPGGRRYVRGPDGLPTGELADPGVGPFDDCFTDLAGPPVLTWPGALELTLAQDHDHWVVFDERPETVCVEPQTGPPDAFRLGRAAHLAAGATLTLTLHLTWRPL